MAMMVAMSCVFVMCCRFDTTLAVAVLAISPYGNHGENNRHLTALCHHNDGMAFSLRLPPALEADARLRCERLGISLNALLCVALDAYLRAPLQSATQAPAQGSAVPGPVSVSAACRPSTEPAISPPVPAPDASLGRQRDLPLAVAPAPLEATPALSRAERRRLERAAAKKR